MKYDKAQKDVFQYNVSFSNLTSEIKQLTASFTVLIAELLEGFAPALTYIANLIQKVVEWFNKLFAALNGRGSYAKVRDDYWKDYAAGLEKSNKQTKKMLDLISGFDELNRLSGRNGSGTIGGISSFNPSDMFEQVELEGFWKKMSEWFDTDTKSLLGFIGALGTAAGLVRLLSNLFGGKNNRLKTQTQLTEADSQATSSFSSVLQGATVAAGAVVTALGLLGAANKDTSATSSELAGSMQLVSQQAADTNKSVNEAYEGMQVSVNSSVLKTIASTAGMLPAITGLFGTLSNNIKSNVKSSTDYVGSTVDTSTAGTSQRLSKWGSVTSQIFAATTANWANNTFKSLMNLNSNIVSFSNGGGTALSKFCSVTSILFANWGKGLIKNVGNTFKNIWNGFKSLMSGIGEKISGSWDSIKVPVLVTLGAVAVGATAIALAPYTGGLSLGALAALKEGGVIVGSINKEVQRLDTVIGQLNEQHLLLKEKADSMKEEFARIKRELNSDTVNPDDFLKINRLLTDSNQKLADLKEIEEKRKGLKTKLLAALDSLNEAWRIEFLALEKDVNHINSASTNLDIQVEFKGLFNTLQKFSPWNRIERLHLSTCCWSIQRLYRNI